MENNASSRIRITTKDSILQISIFNTSVRFEGSQLSFNEDFETEYATDDQTGHLLNSFTSNNYSDRKINLAQDSFNIEFIACKIEIRDKTIDFRGNEISLKNTSFDSDEMELSFEIKPAKGPSIFDGLLSLKNKEESLFSVAKEKVSIKNCIVKISGTTIDCLETECTLDPIFENRLTLQIGKINKLIVNNNPFALILEKETSVEEISVLSSYTFSNLLATSRETKVTINSNSIDLNSVNSLDKLIINQDSTTLTVKNSNLNKTNLIFTKESSLDFNRLNSIATTWNPNMINYHGYSVTDIDPNSNIEAAREFFCQMKFEFSKKDDRVNSGKFYSAEMTALQDYFKSEKVPAIQNLNLTLSKVTSDFGQNWLCPVGWYIFLSFLYVLFLSILHFSFDIFERFNLVDLIFNVLSPTEFKLRELKESLFFSLHFTIQVSWFLWKISASYLVYQLIISFRKYNRSY